MSNESKIESYSIIPNSAGNAILMVATAEGWSLPGHPTISAGKINSRIKKQFGLEVTVFARFLEIFDEAEVVYVVSHQTYGPQPPVVVGGEWVDAARFRSLTVTGPGVQKAVDKWFDIGAGRDQALLSPADWARPGWFPEVSAWMREAALRNGLESTGPVEQFELSPYSATVRMPVSEGYVYFKSAPPKLGHEPALVQELDKRFPGRIPPVLEIDRKRGWLLTEGVDPFNQIQPDLAGAGQYELAVRTYAKIQKSLTAEIEMLAGIGVPDRGFTVLSQLLRDLLDDACVLLFDGDEAITAEEHERLQEYVPQFERLCLKLSELNLPTTLQNVDFWRDNIAVTQDGLVFFDWAESVLASPIMSMQMVLRDFIIHDVADQEELRRRLLEAYLDEWTDHESVERMREAHRICEPAAILCRALSWRDCLSSITEPQRYPYLWPAVAVNVRRLLEFDGLES